MPLSKEEHRKYMKRLTRHNRKLALEYLGGKCVACGSIEELETDHIYNDLDKKRIVDLLSGSWERLKKELDKCQLLCKDCHTEKTILEQGYCLPGERHGHRTIYRKGCRCDLCKNAQKLYMREYMRKRRVSKR